MIFGQMLQSPKMTKFQSRTKNFERAVLQHLAKIRERVYPTTHVPKKLPLYSTAFARLVTPEHSVKSKSTNATLAHVREFQLVTILSGDLFAPANKV